MLHLASQSPRRRELLARLGVAFGTIDIDIPEVRQPGEPASDYVCRVAREKAGAGLLAVVGVPGAVVLGRSEERRVGKEWRPRRKGASANRNKRTRTARRW